MSRTAQIREERAALRRESLGIPIGHGNGHGGLPPVLKMPEPTPSPAEQGVERERRVFRIPLDRIDPDENQPRREFDEVSLRELADSLKQRGQLQPCRVVAIGERYQVVCGERRLRAAHLASLSTLLCLVVDAGEAIEIAADQFVENAARENLTPADLSRAVKHQLDARGCSQHELAKRLGVSQTVISQALAYDALPQGVKEQVELGAISPSTAIEIAKLPDREEQVVFAKKAGENKLTRDQVRGEVKERRGIPVTKAAKEELVRQSSTLTDSQTRGNGGPIKAVEAIGGQSEVSSGYLDSIDCFPLMSKVRVGKVKSLFHDVIGVVVSVRQHAPRIMVEFRLLDGAKGQHYFEPDDLISLRTGPLVEAQPKQPEQIEAPTRPTKRMEVLDRLGQDEEPGPLEAVWGWDSPSGGTIAVTAPLGTDLGDVLWDAHKQWVKEQNQKQRKAAKP
jgi:ParB family chromosome partitioning protein